MRTYLIIWMAVGCVLLAMSREVDGKRKKPKKTGSTSPQTQPCDKTCGRGAKLNENLCKCVCQKGYRYDEYWVQCLDVDECADEDNGCQGRCINNVGSFQCQCGVGFVQHVDGLQCLPEPRFAPCQALACYDGARLKVRKCECECPEGLQYDFINEKCYDLNECESEDNRCDHCANFHGGYVCYCPEGHELSDDGVTCTEVDYKTAAELACDSKICSGRAVLDLVHCECICQDGFYYDEASEACIDENECAYEYCQGVCRNVPGTFKCVCPDGSRANDRGICNSAAETEGLQCEFHQSVCNNGTTCFYESTICDGYADCEDGTDETNCRKLCYPQQYSCANGQLCIDSYLVCNGDNDCGDFSDEIDCDCEDYNPKCRAWSIRDECNENPAFMETSCRMSCEHCLVGFGTESGTLEFKEYPGLYFLRHSEEYAKTTQYVLRNLGRRSGKAGYSWQCASLSPVPKKVRESFRLSTFYEKYTHAYGIPVIGSERVSADALKRACYVLRFMLGDDRQVRQTLYERYARIVVIADDEVITNIPEYSHLPAEFNDLVRGLGGTPHMPVISVGEENLLCERRDPNKKEDFLVKMLAQGIHRLGILSVDLTRRFEFKLEEAYTSARREGIWSKTRNDDTVEEYFSEGVQTFFDVQNSVKPKQYNEIDSRAKLKYYDLKLYSILKDVFPCQNHIVDRCDDQALAQEQTIRINCDVPVEVPGSRNEPFVPIYDPECQDENESCEDWAGRDECTNNPEYMLLNCPKSCDNCEVINLPTTIAPPTDEDEDCEDLDEHCPDWASRGECHGNPAWMRPNCPRSCSACGENPLCFDNNDLCSEWADNGNCEDNAGYMGIFCQRSCDIC